MNREVQWKFRFVEGFCCEVLRWHEGGQYRAERQLLGLRGDTEQAGNEVRLADGVALGQPSDSSLVDHVHRFDSL
jgi:hypothetical protein